MTDKATELLAPTAQIVAAQLSGGRNASGDIQAPIRSSDLALKERFPRPVFQSLEADEQVCEGGESVMYVASALVWRDEPSEAVDPGARA